MPGLLITAVQRTSSTTLVLTFDGAIPGNFSASYFTTDVTLQTASAINNLSLITLEVDFASSIDGDRLLTYSGSATGVVSPQTVALPLVFNVASGPQGVAIQSLAAMIAESITFAARVARVTADPTTRVFTPYLDDPEQTERPHAVVCTGHLDLKKVADTTFSNSGTIELWLADDDSLPDSPGASKVDFLNFVDGVLVDLANAAAVNANLNIVQMRMMMEPVLSSPKDVAEAGGAQNPYWIVKYAIDWNNWE